VDQALVDADFTEAARVRDLLAWWECRILEGWWTGVFRGVLD